MSGQRDRREDADRALEQRIGEALDAELGHRDASFDFEAGLADVYARAGLASPITAVSPIPGATDSSGDLTQGCGGDGAVWAVVEHIAMLDALLGAVTSWEGEISRQLGVMYLRTARQSLWQLRMGLTGRRLSRVRAMQLVETIEHDLTETDKLLRAQQGLSIDDAVRIRIGELRDVGGDLNGQVQRLREQVACLFADVENPVAPRSPILSH